MIYEGMETYKKGETTETGEEIRNLYREFWVKLVNTIKNQKDDGKGMFF